MSGTAMRPERKWQFKTRFRRQAFGWKSQPAIVRIREAVSEIAQVDRTEPIEAAQGAVAFIERLSPALENVDSSSGAIGTAVNNAIAELVRIIVEAFTVRYEGREQALAFLDTVRDLMDPENLYDLRIDTCAADPCSVIAEYRSATRMKGTGLPYCNDYIGRFRIRDGRIACFAEYLDPTRFVIAIGGSVNPPATVTT